MAQLPTRTAPTAPAPPPSQQSSTEGPCTTSSSSYWACPLNRFPSSAPEAPPQEAPSLCWAISLGHWHSIPPCPAFSAATLIWSSVLGPTKTCSSGQPRTSTSLGPQGYRVMICPALFFFAQAPNPLGLGPLSVQVSLPTTWNLNSLVLDPGHPPTPTPQGQ